MEKKYITLRFQRGFFFQSHIFVSVLPFISCCYCHVGEILASRDLMYVGDWLALVHMDECSTQIDSKKTLKILFKQKHQHMFWHPGSTSWNGNHIHV